MASNAPRVFREQTTFQNQKIGVARVYDGGQTGRAIVSGANRIAATAFQFAAEDAQEIAADEGKRRTVQDIITINPETGEPQAISGMKGLGRIASRAYNRVIETRFKQHIGEELMNRGQVLAAQFATDPDGYAETYGDYIAQMAGNAKGKWGEFIREAGTSYLNRTRATIMANGIRAANARYARGVQASTEQGNTALQDLTREVGPAAFLPTLGSFSVEEGGPGANDLHIGKFLGPTSSAFLQPDGSVQRIVTETPERLSFGDSFAPGARDPAYAVSDAQQQVTTYAPNTMFDQPIPRSQFSDYVSGILFEGGPEVAPIPPQANLGTLAGQIAKSVTTGYLDAYYAGIVNEETVRQFDSAQRANIVIGLTGHAFKGIDLTDPDMKLWLNQVGLAVETQRWDLLGRLIPGVKPFLSHSFSGSDLKMMGQVIEADIVNLKTVINDNVAETELRAKAADAAILKRVALLGYPTAMLDDAAASVVDDMIRFSGSPEEYSERVSSLLTPETGLLSNLWADIQDEDNPNVFKAKLDGFREMLVSVAARPIEALVAKGNLTSDQRELLLVQMDRVNRGFSADLREVSPEIASILDSVMKLKGYDPEIGTKVYDQVKDFIDSEERVLAQQERLEKAAEAEREELEKAAEAAQKELEAAQKELEKAADAAMLRRISLLGYPAAMFGDAAEGVVEDIIRFSGSPEEYSRTVSLLLTLENGLLSNLWADIQGEDNANLFKAKLDDFRGMLVSVAARPIETLVAHGKLTSEQREAVLVQLDRLNRGFPADLREVPPEIASLLGSVMKLKSYDPEIGTKVYDQVKDFIDSEEKVLARQEELESAQAADQLATIFAQSLRENANAGFLGPGEAVEQLAKFQLDLESLPNLKATKFNSALQSAYREAARIDIGYFAERMSSLAEFDAFSSYLKTGNKDQLSAISEAYRADVQAMRETLVVKSAIGDSVSALSAVLMDQRASLEAILERNAVDAEQKASTDRVNSGYADYANPRDMEVLGGKIAAAVSSIPSAGFYGKSFSEADYVGPMMDNESVRLAVAREIIKGGAMPTELMNVLQRIASGWVPMPSASSDMTRAIDLFSDIYTSISGRMAITGQFRANKDLETLADLNMYALARTWMEPERFHEFAAKMTGMRGLTTDIEDQAEAVFGKSPEAWIRGEFGTEYDRMFGDERKALVRLATILGGSAGASPAMVRSEIESFSNNFYQPDPAHFLFYSSDSMGAFRNRIKVPLFSAFSLPAQDGPVEEKEIINAVKGYLTEMADKHDINARFAMPGYEVRNKTTGMPVSYNLFEGVFGEGAELFSLVERGWQRGPDGRSYMTYEIFTVDRDGNMNPVMVDGKRQSLSGAEPYFQTLFVKKRLEHEQNARAAERAALEQAAREAEAARIDREWMR